MKCFFLLLFLGLFSQTYSQQKIVELHYNKRNLVNSFNDFGDNLPVYAAGEFIIDAYDKKITFYQREIDNPKSFKRTEYTIDNSVFLIQDIEKIIIGFNSTNLIDDSGRLIGKMEYNPETKIFFTVTWLYGEVVMEKYWINEIFENDKE